MSTILKSFVKEHRVNGFLELACCTEFGDAYTVTILIPIYLSLV
jgi:hypothetical protein